MHMIAAESCRLNGSWLNGREGYRGAGRSIVANAAQQRKVWCRVLYGFFRRYRRGASDVGRCAPPAL